MKKLAILTAVLFLLGGMLFLVQRSSPETRVVAARLTDAAGGEVLVTEESRGLIEWKIQLCWRKGRGPWMTYFLDGDANFWRSVELIQTTNGVEVKHKGKIVGRLNTMDGSFDYPIQKLVVKHPNSIVTSDNPFERSNRTDSLSVGWTSVWPNTILNSR